MLYRLKKLGFFVLCLLFIGLSSFYVSSAGPGGINPEEGSNDYSPSSYAKGSQDWAAEKNGWEDQTSNNSSEKNQGDNFGIDLNTECMLGGTCSFSIYDATKVKKNRVEGERTSVMGFIQDIVLASTTFIGTVVTLALILSGFLYVFSSVDSSLKSKAKNGIKYSLIGMVVVMLSLVIIRLVQFLARGGS